MFLHEGFHLGSGPHVLETRSVLRQKCVQVSMLLQDAANEFREDINGMRLELLSFAMLELL